MKSLRVPERLYQIAMWAISLVFATFLSGLGARVIADLPGVDQSVSLSDFVDSARSAVITTARTALEARRDSITPRRDAAQLALTSATNAWQSTKADFDAWIATRTATTDPAQDPEVLRRTRDIEARKAAERAAQITVEQYDAELLRLQQSLDEQSRQQATLRLEATPRFERAQFTRELRVFGVRLALTLPLLLIAGWLVRTQRKRPSWPLLRGFVLFALMAFFVELVPYLPSYGGYVRSIVGVIASIVVGRWAIVWMQHYIARREADEKKSELTRRQALRSEDALKRMAMRVCPGCERPIAPEKDNGSGQPTNFCVHCAMKLYDSCGACGVRKNAFFAYCPVCGAGASATRPADTTPAAT
jgi:hypothetical protein